MQKNYHEKRPLNNRSDCGSHVKALQIKLVEWLRNSNLNSDIQHSHPRFSSLTSDQRSRRWIYIIR